MDTTVTVALKPIITCKAHPRIQRGLVVYALTIKGHSHTTEVTSNPYGDWNLIKSDFLWLKASLQKLDD